MATSSLAISIDGERELRDSGFTFAAALSLMDVKLTNCAIETFCEGVYAEGILKRSSIHVDR